MKKSKKINNVKVERWKNKRVYVARNEKGQLLSWRKVAGSKIKLSDAKRLFKRQRSFRKDVQVVRLKKVSEVSELRTSSIKKKDSKPLFAKPKKDAQYVVSGYHGKKHIVARSFKIGSTTLVKSSQEAKNDAWSRFLMIVGEETMNLYDEDEGIKNIDKIKNIKEGWVYYR